MSEEREQRAPERGKIIAWWATIFGLIGVIAFGSIFVTRSYLARRRFEIENYRPPHLSRLEIDLEATNRDGRQVFLRELRGKVFVAGYQYTDCPAGCLGMAAVMKSLNDDFGSDPRFWLVSFSVNPEGDTPEKMDAWVKDKGVTRDNWWFLTGDPEKIAKYMRAEFGFLETQKNTDPDVIAAQGEFAHDQRLAIVDENANIRGYYDVMSEDRGMDELKRLRFDLRRILHPDEKL